MVKPRSPDASFIFAVVGPTAVGKSALALGLAEELSTEILSADSMQVYVGMDIGTAKPSNEDRERVRHHLIDVADPRENFSVADYGRLAEPILEEFSRNQRPLVVCGGTGLYMKALFEGLASAPPPDFAFREEMEARAEEEGTPALHRRLAELDPQSAATIHPHDRKRIIRALEIWHSTGTTKSRFEAMQPPPRWSDRVRWYGIIRPWRKLDYRIDARVDEMFRAGLVSEVESLRAMGCSRKHTSMQALGYKEVLEHLEGARSLGDTVEVIKQRTRRFARRQMTWFRPNTRIRWVSLSPGDSEGSEIRRLVEEIDRN